MQRNSSQRMGIRNDVNNTCTLPSSDLSCTLTNNVLGVYTYQYTEVMTKEQTNFQVALEQYSSLRGRKRVQLMVWW